MTVNAAYYLNSVPQNTRTATPEKPGQKDGTAEAGKTQRSAVSASTDQVNLGEDGVAVAQVSRQQGAEQSGAQRQPTAPRRDRDVVEISEKGIAASAKRSAQSAGTATAEKKQYEVEDLSEYTDTELKQMYYNGEITRQEYEDETGETLEVDQ